MNKGRYKQYGYESFKDTETGDIRYDFIDVMNEQNQQIADLEAKLAESEVIIKGGKEEIKDLHRKINEIVERDMNCIQQLKHQLAEEKNRNKKLNHEAQKYYEDAYCNGFQNKIAIESLEKVKESLEDCYGYDYPHLYHFIQSKVDEKIDQQIKSLKGDEVNE